MRFFADASLECVVLIMTNLIEDITRIIYCIVWLLLSIYIFNNEMMPYQHDPVILLFLPLIIPLCCMKAFFYMLPIIVVAEFALSRVN